MYYPGDELTWDDILHPENIAGKPARRIHSPQPLPPPPKTPRREGPIPAIYQNLLTNDPPRRIWYHPGSRLPIEPPTASPSGSPSPVLSPFNIVQCDFPVLPGANRPLPSSSSPAAQQRLKFTHPYRRPISPSTSAHHQPRENSARVAYAHEAQLKRSIPKGAPEVAVQVLHAQPHRSPRRAYLMPSIRRFHSSPSYFGATRDLSSLGTLGSPAIASSVNGDDEEDIVELDTPGAREVSSWMFPLALKEENSSSDPDSEDDANTCHYAPTRTL